MANFFLNSMILKAGKGVERELIQMADINW